MTKLNYYPSIRVVLYYVVLCCVASSRLVSSDTMYDAVFHSLVSSDTMYDAMLHGLVLPCPMACTM